jgi:hypothetical protein
MKDIWIHRIVNAVLATVLSLLVSYLWHAQGFTSFEVALLQVLVFIGFLVSFQLDDIWQAIQ